MAALEDEQAQRKGVVGILYNIQDSKFISSMSSENRDRSKAMYALPFRGTAIHYCYGDARILPAIQLVQQIVGLQGRIRFLAHYGTFYDLID
jgi:hypothetical protein